jgi:hypothetical protein
MMAERGPLTMALGGAPAACKRSKCVAGDGWNLDDRVPADGPHHEADNQEHDEDDKKDLGDRGGKAGQGNEPQQAGDDRENGESQSPAQHVGLRQQKEPLLRLQRLANADRSRAFRQPLPYAALRFDEGWKNNAWPMAAFTVSGWNGLVIKKVGSGRSPVSSRSGKAVTKITGTL